MNIQTDFQSVDETIIPVPFYKNKIILSAIVAFSLIVFAGVYSYSVKVPEKEITLDTSSWNKYVNNEYGFSFSYPEDVSVSEFNMILDSDVHDLQVPFINLLVKSKDGIDLESGFITVSVDVEQKSVNNPYKVTVQTEALKDYEKAMQDSVVYTEIDTANHRPQFFESISKNIEDWSVCENKNFGIKFRYPKEFGCAEVEFYSQDKGIFISIPEDFEWGWLVNGREYSGIQMKFQSYDNPDTLNFKFDKCADENGCDSESISELITHIKQNTNMAVDSYPAFFQIGTGPWSGSTSMTTYNLNADLPGIILHIETIVNAETDSAAGKRLNAELEEILRKIISSIEIQ